MAFYNEVDLGLTLDGDLLLAGGDIRIIRDKSSMSEFYEIDKSFVGTVLQRDILKRLATDAGDFLNANHLAADLQKYRSKNITAYLISNMEQTIIQSLTRDDRVDPTDLNVQCLPVGKDSILVFVFVTIDGEPVNMTPNLLFTMSEGITFPTG